MKENSYFLLLWEVYQGRTQMVNEDNRWFVRYKEKTGDSGAQICCSGVCHVRHVFARLLG